MIGDGISVSWAGGHRGREVLDQLLPQIGTLLSKNGLFYLVVVKENEPEEIKEILAKQGFACESVAKKRAHNEHLEILRFHKK
jgi:release factor glutamine methyltransferase